MEFINKYNIYLFSILKYYWNNCFLFLFYISYLFLKSQLMKKSQEQVFLQVKQKLDYYRLPTVFPYQAVDLLSQLLDLLEKSSRKNEKQNYPIGKNQNLNQLNDALRLQIGKTVKENNRLHLDLLSAKQEILALKHSNDKYLIERSGGSKQMTQLIQAQRKRQDQLFEQLTQVKFKFNELMDLVYQDSQIQKKYIKRLRKYKKYEVEQKKSNINQSSLKKGQHQTVSELEAKVILLQNKIANRESQILRLQRKTQYDGLNMNKILKDFQNNQNDIKLSSLQERISYLQDQNKKMKQQVNYCRKNGGSKQALRQQMRKNNERINKLENQNKQLKRKLKFKQHDTQAKLKQERRECLKIKQNAKKQADEAELIDLTNNDLKKKVQFLQGQVDAAKAALQKQQKINSQKQILIDKIKNSEQGSKILNQYEIQSLKQRIQQLESQLQSQSQRLNILKAENSYHKKQDKLKNQGIQNLQKIVDELMKRNNKKSDDDDLMSQSQNVSLQNTIALRKNLIEVKQSLAITQNQKQKLQREYQILLSRFDNKTKQQILLNDQLNRVKIKVSEMKYAEQQNGALQRQISILQSDLKKQKNLRLRIEEINQQSQNDKARLRKQLQQTTQQYQIYEKKAKNNMNLMKLQIDELQQTKQMLQLMIKEKEKKLLVLEEQLEQSFGKIRILKQQVKAIEQQKHVAVRQKHKYQKRCEQMLKTRQEHHLDNKNNDLDSKQLHNKVIQYQKDIQKLRERISAQNEQIMQLNSYCDAMKISQRNLTMQKSQLKREYQKLKINHQQMDGDDEDQEHGQ